MSNSFGKRFVTTTFGESHGKAIGCIIDGVPGQGTHRYGFYSVGIKQKKSRVNQIGNGENRG